MKLAGKDVLVVGLGRSGAGAARLCAARGGRVTVTDRRPPEELGEVLERLEGCARLELGGHRKESFSRADLIVVSPGVPPIPPLQAALELGVQVVGELELSSWFVQAPIAAITGTNGKSTTTSLLGDMLARSGRATFTGGNLGQPLVEAVNSAAAGPGGAVVVELSSFQLETVQTFRAHVALLLNLSEDHLDRYKSYGEYIAAKARIFERQGPGDFAVVNGDPDQRSCRGLGLASSAPCLLFSMERGRGPGAWLDGQELVVQLPGEEPQGLPLSLLKLAGQHNIQNALAALLGARLMGADLRSCGEALERYRGLPHRMELVGEIAGVRYYNDSKATNVGAVVGSLSGFERPVVLIAGGKDKGGDYQPLADLLRQAVQHVVLIGAAADLMEQALQGAAPLHRAKDLPAAVRRASELARPGDAVVLSPACSSYDMFSDFEQRGAVFAEAVDRLEVKD